MKKINLVIALLVLMTGVAQAQVTKSAAVKQDEVPSAVRFSFEKDFGISPADGEWKVFFSTSSRNGRTVANPIWYTYNKKDSGQKIEVRYYPDGKLKSAKGIVMKNEVYDSDKTKPAEGKSEGS